MGPFYFLLGFVVMFAIFWHVIATAFPPKSWYTGKYKNPNVKLPTNIPLFVVLGTILALSTIFLWPLFLAWFLWHNRKHFTITVEEFMHIKGEDE